MAHCNPFVATTATLNTFLLHAFQYFVYLAEQGVISGMTCNNRSLCNWVWMCVKVPTFATKAWAICYTKYILSAPDMRLIVVVIGSKSTFLCISHYMTLTHTPVEDSPLGGVSLDQTVSNRQVVGGWGWRCPWNWRSPLSLLVGQWLGLVASLSAFSPETV